ncbi:MAG TPA: SurA N-terminal domain-containing protein [Rhizomicrobium sp.]|nr:SurA N-terminal domain-containing protein [Rhizomicrobium sp.]
MLQEMRKYAKSTVASIFLGLLALSFGIWGIADIFHGSADTTVATVGEAKIPLDDYQREYQNYIRNAGAQTGKPLTPEQARAQGVPDQILQQLISRQAVDNVVNGLKLTASDDYVAREIKSIRAFAGPLGTFDHDSFLRAIQESGFTEQTFIAAVRDDTAREQLLGATRNGIEIPSGYAQAIFDYLNEERAVEYVALPASSVTVPKPADAALEAYLKAHAAKFSTPEYRAVTYVAMTPADVMSQVNVTDDQLKQEYEARKESYVVPEKRDIEQITFPDEASAKAARARIDAGSSFDDIAKERKLKPSDIALGTVVEEDLGKDRGAAAFALPLNGVSQPVKGAFGYVLLRVTKIAPGISKSFDDVKADIRKDVMQQLALAQLDDLSNKFEDAQAGGANLSEAAKKLGMHTVTVAAVDSRGMAPDGAKAAVPDEPEFLDQVFKADVGEEGDPFQTKDGNIYVIRVDGVTPPKIRPLDQVRDAATAALMDQERAKLLDAKARSLAAQAGKQQSLANVAAALGTKPQLSGILTRGTDTAPFGNALIDKIFEAPPGSTVYGPAAKDAAYLIARIVGIAHPPTLPTNDPRYKRFIAGLSDQLGGDFPTAFATAARAKQGVSIDQKMADRVSGGGS